MSKSTLSNAEEEAQYPKVERWVLDNAPKDIEGLTAYLELVKNDRDLHVMRSRLCTGTVDKLTFRLNQMRRLAKETK